LIQRQVAVVGIAPPCLALPGSGAALRRGLADDHSLRTSKLAGGGGEGEHGSKHQPRVAANEELKRSGCWCIRIVRRDCGLFGICTLPWAGLVSHTCVAPHPQPPRQAHCC
jgi:hypothetical protein